MRNFNYSKIKEQKWDSELLFLIAGIYKEEGRQELYLKESPKEIKKLVEIAKIQRSIKCNRRDNNNKCKDEATYERKDHAKKPK